MSIVQGTAYEFDREVFRAERAQEGRRVGDLADCDDSCGLGSAVEEAPRRFHHDGCGDRVDVLSVRDGAVCRLVSGSAMTSTRNRWAERSPVGGVTRGPPRSLRGASVTKLLISETFR